MEALAVIIPIAIALGMIFVLMKFARQAKETYGFGMILNWSFVLVVLSVIAGVIGLPLLADNSNNENAMVLSAAWFCLGGAAGYINVKRSNVKFGIIFTILQYIAAIGIIVPIFVWFSTRSVKNALPGMIR